MSTQASRRPVPHNPIAAISQYRRLQLYFRPRIPTPIARQSSAWHRNRGVTFLSRTALRREVLSAPGEECSGSGIRLSNLFTMPD
jgi:hypothetical protein